MRLLHSRILGSASFAVIAAVGLSGTAYGQVTEDEARACANLPTQEERDACLRAQAEDEGGVAETGDIATIPPDEQAERQAETGQTVTVIGTRLRRSAFTTPDPVTIIDPELSLQEGDIETAEILQSTPVAAGSTQITSFLSSNFVTNGGPGAQTLSLRGLGAARTLVLLNGRRAGPAGTRGAVSSFDLNVLPSSIVQSVEILKTGASSVYGSDAIAGVVNILTRRSTDGIELRAFASLPEESGGETYDLSATFGREFDRGHILISASYFRRNELERRDRDYLGCTIDNIFDGPEGTGARADLLDPRTGEPYCGGDFFHSAIALSDFTSFFTNSNLSRTPIPAIGYPGYPGALFNVGIVQFNYPGSQTDVFGFALVPPANVRQFGAPPGFFGVNMTADSTGILNLFNESELQQGSSVIPFTERYTGYLNGSYDITDSITFTAELLFNRRQTRNDSARQFFPTQFTSSTLLPSFAGFCPTIPNPNNPAQLIDDPNDACFPGDPGDPFNQGFTGEVLLTPVIQAPFGTRTQVDYYRGVAALEGDFGRLLDGWNWNVWGQYSRSDGDYEFDIIFEDAVEFLEFRTRSCTGRTTRVRGAPCVNINLTNPETLRGNFTPAEREFLFGVDPGNTVYTQLIGEAVAAGNLWTLPAGPIQAAVGVQWRRDEIDDQPGPATQAGNSWGLTGAGRTAGFQRTQEAFAEVEIPLFREVPIAQSLTFSAAARVTSTYAERLDGVNDSDSGNFTYKLGLNWQINDWVRLRSTYGTSFRSPALFEQFLNDQTSFAGQTNIDPCINWGLRLGLGSVSQRLADNCAAVGVPSDYTGLPSSSATVSSGGGIGVLNPETSTALTASVIFTPPGWLWNGGRFSLAVDYFDIRVEGEIATLGAANILSGCFNSEFFPEDPLCDLFVRETNPTDPRFLQILTVRNPFININSQNNRGIDVTARFIQDLGRMGRLQLLAQMTWQLEDEFGLFGNTVVDNNGEMGDPKFIGDFNATWSIDPFTIVYGLDVIGGTSDREDVVALVGDSLCANNAFRGLVCADFRGEPTFYHSLSATVELMDRFQITLGVNNIFDTQPPIVSRFNSGTGGNLGQIPILGSQYDLLGRRFFAAIRARF